MQSSMQECPQSNMPELIDLMRRYNFSAEKHFGTRMSFCLFLVGGFHDRDGSGGRESKVMQREGGAGYSRFPKVH